jgi:hypothetical protein
LLESYADIPERDFMFRAPDFKLAARRNQCDIRSGRDMGVISGCNRSTAALVLLTRVPCVNQRSPKSVHVPGQEIQVAGLAPAPGT